MLPLTPFFSSPSNTLWKLVNTFPKTQKHTLHISQLPQPGSRHEKQPFESKVGVEYEEEDSNTDVIDITELDGNGGYQDEFSHLPASSAAEDDRVDADNGVDDETDYISSSDSEYPRPRIRQDLLPHDFSSWQKSQSIASSTSREAETFSEVLSSNTSQDRFTLQGVAAHARCSRAKGYGEHLFNPNSMESHKNPSPCERQRNPSPAIIPAKVSLPFVDLHLHKLRQKLPDLKPVVIAHGTSRSCKYGSPVGLKGLPEDCWSVQSGALGDAKCNSVDVYCWQRRKVQERGTHYRNLVDMMPSSETYRERQEDGYHWKNFQHHASMVYTQAPPRDISVKKVIDAAKEKRVSRSRRRVKKKSGAMWEEQENQLRGAGGPDLSGSPRRVSYENAVEILKLQGQVEELQWKLSITQGLPESKNKGAEIHLLVQKVEKLSRKIAEKDRLLESAQETLRQKENEIQAMQMNLWDSEETSTRLRAKRCNTEEEVVALRWEVAALRWQIEVDAERARSEIKNFKDNKEMHGHAGTKEQEEEWEVSKMEAVRKMYLAAVIVARLAPREECLALVHILRVQLQCILRIPTSLH